MTGTDLLILQLADSAFPSGGFAHSGGLEAAWQQGRVVGSGELSAFIDSSLLQAARMGAPFVIEACRRPELLERLDREHDALLSNHVANRASRSQGRAFLFSAERAFARQSLTALAASVRATGMPGHLAPVFGAGCGCLGLSPERAAGVCLFVTLRGVVSAAVRLGIIGPMEGQGLQFAHSERAAMLAQRAMAWPSAEAAQPAPVLELLQMNHDRLYSRLFQS